MPDPTKRSRIIPGILAALVVAGVGGFLVWRQFNRPDRNGRPEVEWPEPEIPAALLTWRPVDGPVRAYPGGERAWGLAVTADGTVALCGEAGLAVFAPGSATPVPLATDLAIRAVAPRGDGSWLSAVGDAVVVLGADGEEQERWRVFGQGARIDAIACGPDAIWVADGGHLAVWRLAPDGRPLAHWGYEAGDDYRLKVPGPWFDLAADGRGVAVANPGRHRVQFYDAEGNLRGAFGRVSSTDLEGFVGCCNPVALAVTASGDVVVTEKGLSRVKVMSPSGELKSVVAGYDTFSRTGKLRAFAIDVAVDPAGRVYVLENRAYTVLVFEPE